MKSLYKRELTMMVGIVALSFTLLSTAFMLLSYRYIISETRDRLERNAGYIAAATSDYLQNVDSLSLLDGIKWTLYQSTMETVSAVSEASVIVTDTQGEILYATDRSRTGWSSRSSSRDTITASPIWAGSMGPTAISRGCQCRPS